VRKRTLFKKLKKQKKGTGIFLHLSFLKNIPD